MELSKEISCQKSDAAAPFLRNSLLLRKMLANQAAAAAAALSRTTVSCHQSVVFMSVRVRAFVGPPTERERERESLSPP